jgi:hypothetical protein
MQSYKHAICEHVKTNGPDAVRLPNVTKSYVIFISDAAPSGSTTAALTATIQPVRLSCPPLRMRPPFRSLFTMLSN